MERYAEPAQASPTIVQLNGGLGWLEVECNRCKTGARLRCPIRAKLVPLG